MNTLSIPLQRPYNSSHTGSSLVFLHISICCSASLFSAWSLRGSSVESHSSPCLLMLPCLGWRQALVPSRTTVLKKTLLKTLAICSELAVKPDLLCKEDFSSPASFPPLWVNGQLALLGQGLVDLVKDHCLSKLHFRKLGIGVCNLQGLCFQRSMCVCVCASTPFSKK